MPYLHPGLKGLHGDSSRQNRTQFRGVQQVLWSVLWEQGRQIPGYLEKKSNSHGLRPVHQIISIIKWIQTSRLSMKNFLSSVCCGDKDEVLVHTAGCKPISAPSGFLVHRNLLYPNGITYRRDGIAYHRGDGLSTSGLFKKPRFVSASQLQGRLPSRGGSRTRD